MELLDVIALITYVLPLIISAIWLTTELISYYKITKEPFKYIDIGIFICFVFIPLLNVLVMRTAIIEWLDLDK